MLLPGVTLVVRRGTSTEEGGTPCTRLPAITRARCSAGEEGGQPALSYPPQQAGLPPARATMTTSLELNALLKRHECKRSSFRKAPRQTRAHCVRMDAHRNGNKLEKLETVAPIALCAAKLAVLNGLVVAQP